jgi:DNA-binding MarR family transcriptional regulator
VDREATIDVYTYITMSVSTERIDVTTALFGLPCACGSLRRASRVLTRIYDDALRPSGLEIMQFGIMASIDRLGEATQRQLSVGFAMDSTTLTRTLGRLQRRGWIGRRPGQDKRQRILRLTKQGLARLEQARPLWRRAQETLHGAIGKEAFETLTRMSREVVAAMSPSGSGPIRRGPSTPGLMPRKRS